MIENLKNEVGNIESVTGVDYKTVDLNDSIIKRWTDLGLLEGLKDELRDTLALCYEKLAVYLINECSDGGEFDVPHFEKCMTVVFPYMRRVVQTLGYEVEPEVVLRTVVKLYGTFKDDSTFKKIEDVIGVKDLDFEAELCRLVSDSIVCDLIRGGKYKLVKVEENKEK